MFFSGLFSLHLELACLGVFSTKMWFLDSISRLRQPSKENKRKPFDFRAQKMGAVLERKLDEDHAKQNAAFLGSYNRKRFPLHRAFLPKIRSALCGFVSYVFVVIETECLKLRNACVEDVLAPQFASKIS